MRLLEPQGEHAPQNATLGACHATCCPALSHCARACFSSGALCAIVWLWCANPPLARLLIALATCPDSRHASECPCSALRSPTGGTLQRQVNLRPAPEAPSCCSFSLFRGCCSFSLFCGCCMAAACRVVCQLARVLQGQGSGWCSSTGTACRRTLSWPRCTVSWRLLPRQRQRARLAARVARPGKRLWAPRRGRLGLVHPKARTRRLGLGHPKARTREALTRQTRARAGRSGKQTTRACKGGRRRIRLHRVA